MVAQLGNDKPEAKILVVDDEPTIRELLSASLRFAGFDVATAQDGTEAIRVDGFEVLAELREREPNLPVLFLTAKDDVQDRVRGLEVGADDYVTKPFSLEEVVARIHAILRRTAPEMNETEPLRYHDLEMDEDSYEVRRAGRDVELSPTEYQLLRYLLINAERVVSKIQILEHVWDYNWEGEASIVESYISYLRRKIDSAEALGITDPEEAAALEPLIHTKRGIGYVLRRAK